MRGEKPIRRPDAKQICRKFLRCLFISVDPSLVGAGISPKRQPTTKMKTVAFSHTPGPWLVIEMPGAIDVIPGTLKKKHNNGKRPICRLQGADKRANARLIAATPDLIASLELLLFAYEGLGGDMQNNAPRYALSSIAKATS